MQVDPTSVIEEASHSETSDICLPCDSIEGIFIRNCTFRLFTAGNAFAEFEVEDVVAVSQDRNLFEVRWVGYEESTWEPLANLLTQEIRNKVSINLNPD